MERAVSHRCITVSPWVYSIGSFYITATTTIYKVPKGTSFSSSFSSSEETSAVLPNTFCGTSILLSLSSSDSLDNSESLAVPKSIISLIFIFSIQHILVSSSNIKKIIYSKIDYYFWHKYSLIFIMTPYGVIHFQKIICKWGNKLCLQSLH